MDRAAYLGMHGAKSSMHQLEIITNNLANANTPGFRADFEVTKQQTVNEQGQQTRVFSTLDSTYIDFKPGPVINTGSDLDIAISGDGFLAVQTKNGGEAYTRAGNLQLTNEGILTTSNGDMLLGDSGLISIPPAEKISIAKDGTVSARLIGTTELVTIDRIKLANPVLSDLQKGESGLFYLKTGDTAIRDNNIQITQGALEGSNVNTIETLTKLIDLSRHFEQQTNLLQTLSENATKANQILEAHS